MSDYKEQDGDLSVFVADKEGNDKRPDLTGYIWLGGEKKRVSLWERNSGKLRYSGRVELEPYNGAGSGGVQSKSSNNASTEVPF
tara:strand:- start:665 stop:916 length:252 start_codon:yes stop_codon:yes gene_type:complete